MSPLAIVAVSIVACLYAVLSLIAAGAIVYGQLRLQRQISESSNVITRHRDELKLTVKDIGVTLETHRSKMDAFIAQIHGEEISQAAKAIISSTTRIEKATIAFGELARHLLSEDAIGGGEGAVERAAASGLGPESYAPNPTNERYTSVSRTAAGDIEAAAELDDVA